MNYKEIGSEFWLENQNVDDGSVFVLSGRTAIDLILQDMKASCRCMDSVYMPAWCCDSMLQPFIDRGVNIEFYDVSYENNRLSYHIDYNSKVDILYVTNYFGYDTVLSAETISQFKARNCAILYDRTHSLFRENDVTSSLADYTFASVRKWLGVPCGALALKNGGEMDIHYLRDFPYLQEKIDAMQLKANYMNEDGKSDKQAFLDLFVSFGHHLVEDYRNYKMDIISRCLWLHADRNRIMEKRCANVTILQSSLQEIPQVSLLFNMTNGDCPLFVPILLDSKDERDALRRHLTSNAIYCPIHWPKPSTISNSMAVDRLYDCELSLICDQRYDFDDMQRIINTIKEFYQ